MNLNEIKQAVNEGKTVHYKDKKHYIVKAGANYYIRTEGSEYCVSLTCLAYEKLNGEEKDFFVAA